MASEMPVFARFPASCLGFAPPGSMAAPALPGNEARTGPRRSVYPAHHACRAPCAAWTERGQGRAGATRPSSQSQWSCWLLVSAMLGDSVWLGAVPMEDMDLVILTEIRSSLLIVFLCL